MMDAPVERDVKLQKASAELLADFQRSSPKLLRKPLKVLGAADRLGPLRSRTREREALRLISLVNLTMFGGDFRAL